MREPRRLLRNQGWFRLQASVADVRFLLLPILTTTWILGTGMFKTMMYEPHIFIFKSMPNGILAVSLLLFQGKGKGTANSPSPGHEALPRRALSSSVEPPAHYLCEDF